MERGAREGGEEGGGFGGILWGGVGVFEEWKVKRLGGGMYTRVCEEDELSCFLNTMELWGWFVCLLLTYHEAIPISSAPTGVIGPY